MTIALVQGAVVDRFAAEYQAYNDLSDGRRRDQLRALTSLCHYAQVEDPTECTADHYRAWLVYLQQDEQKKAVTVEKYGKMVRAFFGWAYDARLYPADQLMDLRRVPYPQTPKALPRPYKSKEIKALWGELAKAHPLDDGKFLTRWRRGTSRYKKIANHAHQLQLTAIVRLALDCGLRREELFDLDIDDMHYDNAYVVVRNGKGNKPREVPYTKAARAAAKAWIEFRTELSPDHDRPWLSLTALGPDGVWLRPMNFRRFSMYLKNIGPKWTLHRLRHTCATMWLRSGMPIDKVSKLLGHASIQQTQVYTELINEDVQREVERNEDRFEEQVAA
jgi:site-specific recombinase XerD